MHKCFVFVLLEQNHRSAVCWVPHAHVNGKFRVSASLMLICRYGDDTVVWRHSTKNLLLLRLSLYRCFPLYKKVLPQRDRVEATSNCQPSWIFNM
jgi:hypothetical protein